jgi:hypothetical protein
MKHNKAFIEKMIEFNTEGFYKIAHSENKNSPQEQYLQAQREVLFKELQKIEDSFNNA